MVARRLSWRSLAVCLGLMCPATASAELCDFSRWMTRPDASCCEAVDGCVDSCVDPLCSGVGCIDHECTDDGCTGGSCTADPGLLARLADSGIVFKADLYQMYQGVAAGGLRQEFDYGGHGDYEATLDLDKLAGREGLYLKLKAEHRFGGLLGSPPTGSILPSAIQTTLPGRSNDLMLTNVLFTQFLSEEFAFSFGKLDTFDGDQNEFASGRGKTQFSNVAFVVNPALFRSVPYSTLGVTFTYLQEKQPIFNFTVMNSTYTAGTAGFDELFDQGASLIGEGRVPTNFGGKPGHQLLGVTWSSRSYASLGDDPRLGITPTGIPQQSGSWAVYWNADQYLVYDDGGCTGEARGWGVFGRAGYADGDTNPIEYFLSFGVGGNAMIRGREKDYFGIGWFQVGTSDDLNPITSTALNLGLQGQGIEMYYRIQATEHLQITPDIQILDPARQGIDDAYLVGVRALLSF